jgi:hypothetical protein
MSCIAAATTRPHSTLEIKIGGDSQSEGDHGHRPKFQRRTVPQVHTGPASASAGGLAACGLIHSARELDALHSISRIHVLSAYMFYQQRSSCGLIHSARELDALHSISRIHVLSAYMCYQQRSSCGLIHSARDGPHARRMVVRAVCFEAVRVAVQ